MRLRSIMLAIGSILFVSFQAAAQSCIIYTSFGAGALAPDPTFIPIVHAPTYPYISTVGTNPVLHATPVVGIDRTHQNAFSLDPTCPRYAALAQLLTADGAIVQDFSTPFGSSGYSQALNGLNILVIADATGISAAEASAISAWVSAGHGLIIAGSIPSTLTTELMGVTWVDGDPEREFNSCTDAVSPYGPGWIKDNDVITEGLKPSEEVFSVYEYTGPAIPPVTIAATSILSLRAGARTNCFYNCGAYFDLGIPADGYSRGLAFQLGAGKVFASGDSRMFSAVLWAGYGIYIIPGVKTYQQGMQVYPSNQQFLLNIVHWIDGLLPDSDGDGYTDSRDQCSAPLI